MSIPHVLISRQEDIPESLLDPLIGALTELSIPFEAEQRELRIYNSIEHYVPTALVVFLAKPFFDGFLKKAGEDTYSALKRGLAALATRTSSIKISIVSSGHNKITENSPYSRVLSVYSQTVSGIRIKFILPTCTSETEALTVFDSMLTLLRDHHSKPDSDTLTNILSATKTPSLQVLYYDALTNSWKLLKT